MHAIEMGKDEGSRDLMLLLFPAIPLLWRARPKGTRVGDRNQSIGKSADAAPRVTSLPALQPGTAGIPVRLALARLRQRGISPSSLLRKARLSTIHIETPEARFGAASQVAFLELAAAALADPFLGFTLGRDIDLRQIGLLYYAAASSSTLGDALDRAQRYGAIVNEGIAVQCTAGRDLRIALRHTGVSRHTARQQTEFIVTAIVRLCRALTNRKLTPKGIRLVHQRVRDTSEFELFMGSRISFGAHADEVVFDGEVQQLPLVGADPYLNEMLLRYCEEAVSTRGFNTGHLRVAVENAVTPLLPHGDARIRVVARQLGMSSRTLARRLAAEGITFDHAVDQLRADLAKRYLQESSLSNSQIAWLVGYRSVSAFTRACTRWTGMTPGKFRHGARGCASSSNASDDRAEDLGGLNARTRREPISIRRSTSG